MKRVFIPGSEWLYLKLYTGHKSAENLLIDYLYPMSMKLKNQGIINDFFFIRYTDPNFHIRFRLKVDNVLNYGQVFQSINQTLSPCIDNGMIADIQCDTYRREMERYGKERMPNIEKLFCIDSQSIIELLKKSRQSESPEEDRWQLALLLIDELMSAFQYGLEDKKSLMEKMSQNFKNEFGFTSNTFTKQLNDKYRLLREQIDKTINRERDQLCRYDEIIANRFDAILHIIPRLDSDMYAKNAVLYSLIHMTMNRMFRSQNRLHEMVIYDFLFRYYRSRIAKVKYIK